MQSLFSTFEGARRFGGGVVDAQELKLPLQLARALKAGDCPADRDFDRFLPKRLRRASAQFWTPLVVAARAAKWFDELNIRSVVDIGSGSGKFCIAAALLSRARFLGIEQRAELVAVARVIAQAYGVDSRAGFVEGRFGEVPIPLADAYYFFNPFEENLFRAGWQLDDTVELDQWRFTRDVSAARVLLTAAPPGTYVLTYNGLGCRLPGSYTTVRVARDLPCVLKLARQGRSRD
jgi:SAM-dependent methyltransferase